MKIEVLVMLDVSELISKNKSSVVLREQELQIRAVKNTNVCRKFCTHASIKVSLFA